MTLAPLQSYKINYKNIYFVQMETKLTRRKFIQKTISAGSAVSVAGLAVFPDLQPYGKAFIRCNNCGVYGKQLTSASSLHLLKKRFCPNCGIDLYSNSYPINKRCSCSTAGHELSKKKGTRYHPPCCQVPFPDNALAGSTNKPVFSVADLKF